MKVPEDFKEDDPEGILCRYRVLPHPGEKGGAYRFQFTNHPRLPILQMDHPAAPTTSIGIRFKRVITLTKCPHHTPA